MIKREHRPILIGAVFILFLSLVVVLWPQNPMHLLDYKAKMPYPPRPNADESIGFHGGQAPATVPYHPPTQGEETRSTESTHPTDSPEPRASSALVPSLPITLPSIPSPPTHQPEVSRKLTPFTREGALIRSIYETYHNAVVSVRLIQASTGKYYPLDTSFTACCIGQGLYLSNWSNLQNYGDHFGNLYMGNSLAVMASNSTDLAPVKIRAYDVFTDIVVLELTQAYRDHHDPSSWPALPLSWDPELIPLIVKLWPPSLLFGEAASGNESPLWIQSKLPIVELHNALLGTNIDDYVGTSVYLIGAPASIGDSEHIRPLTITASHVPIMSEEGDMIQLFDCDQSISSSMIGSLVLDGNGRFFGILNNNQAFQPRMPGNSILSAFTCYQGLAKLGFSFGMDASMVPQESLEDPKNTTSTADATSKADATSTADATSKADATPTADAGRKEGDVTNEEVASAKEASLKEASPKEAPLAPTDPHSYWTSLGIYFLDDLSLLSYKRTFPSSQGVLIKAIKMDSQASRAGFQAGDILICIDGQDVQTGREAVELLRQYSPGQEILCEVLRGRGQRFEIRVYPDFGLAGSLQ